MTGDFLLPRNSYPVQGNTNKAISYESRREIFLSRHKSFPMLTEIDMHDNLIQNVSSPGSSHQATNKGYCDFNFLNRQKGRVMMGPHSMNRNALIALPDTTKFGTAAVNKNYVDGEISKNQVWIQKQFIKESGDTMSGDLDMDTNFLRNVGIDNTAAMPKSYIDALTSNVISYPITTDIDMSNQKLQI